MVEGDYEGKSNKGSQRHKGPYYHWKPRGSIAKMKKETMNTGDKWWFLPQSAPVAAHNHKCSSSHIKRHFPAPAKKRQLKFPPCDCIQLHNPGTLGPDASLTQDP